MKFIKYCVLLSGIALLMGGCVSKTSNNNEVKEEYGHTLEDSIKSIEVEIDSCRSQVSLLSDQVGVWMRDFTNVSKPREAGSYLIMSSWVNRYPLTSTGLVARINDNGQFELIAALSGGTFEAVSVQAPEETAVSDNVPNDQALNYRANGLNTVLFTGEKADAIGELISDNELNPLTLSFIQGNGKVVKTWKISSEYAKMISYTWLLYSNKMALAKAQAKIPMLQEKIKILRIHHNGMTQDETE